MQVADTLSRMAASVRFHSTGSDVWHGKSADAIRLAVAYQLVTDKTNFLLVYERADGEKATDMPVLQPVDQMLPAGWGGTGSVMFSRSSAGAASAPAVFRSVRRSSINLSSLDNDFELPAFLRRHADSVEADDTRHWAESEHYSGLTPLRVSEWLRTTPVSEWPTTYQGLRQMGLGAWLVDWLELSISTHGGSAHDEPTVVEAFLYLMSRRETRELMAKSEGLLSAFMFTVQRLRGLFASDPAGYSASVDLTLVKVIVEALESMTASACPDRVLALGDTVEGVC